MDHKRFKEVLSAFVDSAGDLEVQKGSVAIQIGGEVITGELRLRDGSLQVTEGPLTLSAERWIVRRIAMLDLLAERVIENVAAASTFVTPHAEVLNRVDLAPTDIPVKSDDAVARLGELLDERPGGTCSVVYLTSDAGEGKTTVINQLANCQARRFREGGSDWLLVPISLAGKPFLRFEDVIVASLMNQLRFQRLYFEAFVELVKMGVLVPALDGFEEVFVETADGDAVSSLGTLIRQLGGSGTLLIAARKAYFEFRSLDTQARLLDALPDLDVGFSRLRLLRWGEQQFVDYCALNGIADGARLYSEVRSRVDADHPLLTRAVLVRRLVKIAALFDDYEFIAAIHPESDEFFNRFIDQILEREASEKWIDKVNDPPLPLLSVQEHHELLSYLAEEMWVSKKSVVSVEMLDSLAELLCESFGKSPVVTRQVRERIKQHALIITSPGNRREFAFDHDNFREFFLGEQLGRHLAKRDISDIRKLMRVDLLPGWTLDTATTVLESQGGDSLSALECVAEAAKAESPSSYVRENAAGVLVRLLERVGDTCTAVENLVFPTSSLQGRHIHGCTFKNCYFRPTSLASSKLNNCHFVDCEFERLDFDKKPIITSCSMDPETKIRVVGAFRGNELVDVYDPREIQDLLQQNGFSVSLKASQIQLPLEEASLDARLPIFEKAIHTFQRATHVNIGTFRLRLSLHANEFFDQILPDLKRAGILQELPHSLGHDKYKLAVPMSVIASALNESRGSYDRCLQLIKSHHGRA